MRRSRKPFGAVRATGVRIPPFPHKFYRLHMLKSVTKYCIGIIIISFFCGCELAAQTAEENWVPIKFQDSKKIYVNSTGLANFSESDFFVWVLEENYPPVAIEEIREKVFKTKSYYLFNKTLRRYSILQIILYDENSNVLKSYSYERNMDYENFKYNYPIFSESDEEQILDKCLELIGSQNN